MKFLSSIRFGFAVALLAIIVSGCLKQDDNDSVCPYTDSPQVATTSEITALQNFITSNSLVATAHSSGIFYNITEAGTGTVAPTVCSRVTVKYTGQLTSGVVFDSNTTGVAFTLGQLILGWQKGIPLIRAGGKIRLYVPPSLGYGASGAPPTIPANAYLIFDIELIAVQ